ncbi:hypothetical protein Tco_0407932 [Tanacetum coccineum]
MDGTTLHQIIYLLHGSSQKDKRTVITALDFDFEKRRIGNMALLIDRVDSGEEGVVLSHGGLGFCRVKGRLSVLGKRGGWCVRVLLLCKTYHISGLLDIAIIMANLPPPNNDLNVPEDKHAPAPEHAPIAPNPAPIQLNDYLADNEEPKEEEEPIPEQAPAAPDGFAP